MSTYFLRDLLDVMIAESERLFATGPRSVQDRTEVATALKSAQTHLREFAIHAAQEDRVGG